MKLLIGQANSGKTESLFARIAELVSNRHGNASLLTPSTNAANVLMERLQHFIHQELPMNAKPVPLSFPALSQKLLKAGGGELKFLTAIQRHRLLQSVIADLSQEEAFVYFDKTIDKPGLVHSLAKFINELWRSGIDAEEFTNLTQNHHKKDQEVGLIFQRYETALRQTQTTDAEGGGLYALRLLERIDRSEALNREIVIQNLLDNFPFIAADGFDFYTPVQVKMLSQLSKLGIEVMATLTFEADRAVHLWQKRTLERFVGEQAEIIHFTSPIRNKISATAARFMSDKREPEPDNDSIKVDEKSPYVGGELGVGSEEAGSNPIGHISNFENDTRGEIAAQLLIISAPDRALEIRELAREVKCLVIEDKFSLNEITVVCRSLDLYKHHFERVFSECFIRFELDNQLALIENVCIIALLRLLSLADELFPRRAVLESLRSPYFDFSEFELHEEQIDLLEQISYAEMITDRRDQWLDALEHPTPKSKIDGNVKAANSIEPELSSSLASRLDKYFEAITFKPHGQRSEFVRAIENLITTLKIDLRMKQGQMPDIDEAPQQITHMQQTIAAFQTFQGLLESLGEDRTISHLTGFTEQGKSEPGGNSPAATLDHRKPANEISWSAFFAELESAVAATSFSRPREHSPTIIVQEAHNLRPRNYRAIFVVGLIEGEFPRKSAETAPYSIAEKTMLRSAGIDFAETINDAGADLTQFHKAMTRASERLYLSYARSDFSGGELLKSYLIDEVISVTATNEIGISQFGKWDESIASREVLSLEELALLTARRMRKRFERVESVNRDQTLKLMSAVLDVHLPSWPATLRGALIEGRRLTGNERGTFGGIILDAKLAEKMKTLFGEDYLWSASKINDYGLCPFRFFANNVLNLSPIEEPEEGFVADRLGTAYHEILEKTYVKLKEQGIDLTADTLERATTIAEGVCEVTLQKLLDERKIRKSGMWDYDKSEIKKRVVNLLRYEINSNLEQAAKPLAFEQHFGFGNTPPLVIQNEEGNIKIRGSIDRIDKTEDGLVVIDYKTSRSPINAKEAIEGRNLQLPIYLMAANRVLKRDESVTSGFYLHIYSCKRGSEFPNKNIALEVITARAEAYIGDYVHRARRAEFPVEPNQNRCPPYCRFDVMCRIQSLGVSTEDL